MVKAEKDEVNIDSLDLEKEEDGNISVGTFTGDLPNSFTPRSSQDSQDILRYSQDALRCSQMFYIKRFQDDLKMLSRCSQDVLRCSLMFLDLLKMFLDVLKMFSGCSLVGPVGLVSNGFGGCCGSGGTDWPGGSVGFGGFGWTDWPGGSGRSSIESMGFDNPKVYGGPSIFIGLIHYNL